MEKKTDTGSLKEIDKKIKGKRNSNNKKPRDNSAPWKAGQICLFRDKITKKETDSSLARKHQLVDAVFRKKYLDSYFETINPLILFGAHPICKNSYDIPTSDARNLQFNAILATSLRYFGVSPTVYSVFIEKAVQLSGKLICDFSLDTALGFHCLAYYYWSEDIILSNHYKNISKSICTRTLEKGTNSKSMVIPKLCEENLLTLKLLSMGIDRNNYRSQEFEKEITPIKERMHGNNMLKHIVLWSKLHFFLDNYLLYNDEIRNVNNPLDLETFNDVIVTLDGVVHYFHTTIASDVSKKGVTVMDHFIRALALYYVGFKEESFKFINDVLSILDKHPEIVQLGNGQLVPMFHSIFMVAYNEKNYEIASKINNLQRKQTYYFPIAVGFERKDRELTKCIEFTSNDSK